MGTAKVECTCTESGAWHCEWCMVLRVVHGIESGALY